MVGMAKSALDDAEQIEITNQAMLRDWLKTHHVDSHGVWVVTYKKTNPDRHVPASAITDTCLCFGWIDSLPRKKDDHRSMLYISPRNPKANWSRVNKEKVAALKAAGLMHPAGEAAVALAKESGTWNALDDVENLVIPPDLQAAFDATPGALKMWDDFPRSVKRGALEILLNAKRAETRAKKVAEIVSSSAQNIRPFQWRK